MDQRREGSVSVPDDGYRLERGMRVEVTMPNLGYDMEVGTIVSWAKAVGDSVQRGEVIAEIETDKTTVEMEAMATGMLVEIVQEAGAEVPVGGVIAYLEAGS